MHKDIRTVIEHGQREGWVARWEIADGRHVRVTTAVGEVIICNAEPRGSRAVASTRAIFERARRDVLAVMSPRK